MIEALVSTITAASAATVPACRFVSRAEAYTHASVSSGEIH